MKIDQEIARTLSSILLKIKNKARLLKKEFEAIEQLSRDVNLRKLETQFAMSITKTVDDDNTAHTLSYDGELLFLQQENCFYHPDTGTDRVVVFEATVTDQSTNWSGEFFDWEETVISDIQSIIEASQDGIHISIGEAD